MKLERNEWMTKRKKKEGNTNVCWKEGEKGWRKKKGRRNEWRSVVGRMEKERKFIRMDVEKKKNRETKE